MIYSNVIATLALVVAILGAVPGILSLRKLYEEAKATVRVDVSWPLYSRTSPHLFVQITLEPGAKAIHISSIESAGSGLGIAAGPSTRTLSTLSCNASADTATGPLQLSLNVPSREESRESLSTILLFSNANRDSLSSITPDIRWTVVSKRRLKYEHKTTITTTLIDANAKRVQNAHAEITI